MFPSHPLYGITRLDNTQTTSRVINGITTNHCMHSRIMLYQSQTEYRNSVRSGGTYTIFGGSKGNEQEKNWEKGS